MFKKKVVFVVGAGASAELALPTGHVLKTKIANDLRFRFDFSKQISGDWRLLDLLKRRFEKDINTYTKAANELSEVVGSFVSIDEALHYFSSRPEIILLGKLAIAYEIIAAEAECKLADRNTAPLANTVSAEATWLPIFFSMAISSLRREETLDAFENITIVNFNYDRVIEFYLYSALQTKIGLTPSEAAQCLSKLKIIRPYGGLGGLEWQGRDGVQFGVRPHQWSAYEAIIARLRTYTERYEDNLVPAIEDAMCKAQLIVFLGFGFNSQNLQLLLSRQTGRKSVSKNVFGTVLGINAANHSMIESELRMRFGSKTPIQLFPLESAKMLNELRLSILGRGN